MYPYEGRDEQVDEELDLSHLDNISSESVQQLLPLKQDSR